MLNKFRCTVDLQNRKMNFMEATPKKMFLTFQRVLVTSAGNSLQLHHLAAISMLYEQKNHEIDGDGNDFSKKRVPGGLHLICWPHHILICF